MNYQRKRVAKRLASGLLAGALALGGLAISGGSVSAKTPSSPSTNRLYGADRYETSVAIARNQVGVAGPSGGLVIATGENPTDALAASVLTSDTRPMLLVRKDSVPQSVADFITDFKSVLFVGQPRIYVIGGTNAISEAVATALGTLATTTGDTTPPLVTRISGADRFATAKAIGAVAGITNATDTMIIVNGEDGKWADALSAGPIASENTWPIVTTNASGLQASAKESVDAYIALAGSSKKFLIIGGPASVSTSVEEYLIGTKLIAPANIRRIGGVDRYHTNFLTNLYLAATWGGAKLALVSGEAPFDALAAASWAAKNNTHLVMTPAAGGNTFVSTLAGALNATVELGSNSELWVLGGRTAVSDTARSGYIAAATAENLTATLTDCVVGKATATLELSGRLTSTELSKVSVGAYMTLNAATAVGSALVDNAGPGDVTRQSFTVTLAAAPALGDTLKFSGFTEGATVLATGNYVHKRSIASATCAAAVDSTRPTATLRVITGATSGSTVTTSAGAILLLSTSEPVTLGGSTISANGTSVTGSAISFGSTALTKNVRAADISGTGTEFVITVATDETATLSAAAPYTVVTIASSWIKDLASPTTLSPVVDVVTTSAPDVTGPTLTAVGVTCTAGNLGSWTAGDLTLTAVALKALDGAVANQYTMSVVNSRGLLKPSVKVDATAKTITITADTGYHTVADVDNELDNAGIDSVNVTTANLTANGAKRVSATALPAVSLGGDHNCAVLVVGNEPFFLDTGFTVSVAGLSAGYVTNPGGTYSNAYNATGFTSLATSVDVITFTTKLLGAGSIGFDGSANGLFNQKGVVGGTPVTFTAG